MADEVVARAGAIGQLSVLSVELLHVILAEIPQPERVGFANRRGGEFLGDRHQQDVGPLASGPCSRPRDAGFYLF